MSKLEQDLRAEVERLRKSNASLETQLAEVESFKKAIDAHSVVAATDVKGTILYANDKFCTLSKYSRDELVGANHRIVSSGHHSKAFFKDMYATIAKGRTWRGEIKNRAKDGSHYWVDTTITPIRNAENRIVRYISVRTEITTSKIIEETLERHVQILKTTFQNFPGGISVFSKSLMLQSANPEFYRLLDLPPDMFEVGSTYEDIIRYNVERGEYGDDGGDVERQVAERVALARKFEKHVIKRVRPGGPTLEIKGTPLPEGGFVTTYVDVSDIEKMMVALEEKSSEAVAAARALRKAKDIQTQTHQRLITSVNSMRNGLVIWGSDDRLVLANDAYLAVHDPIREQLVPGVRFEDMLRAGCASGIWLLGDLDAEQWVAGALAARRQEKEREIELQFTDGRQMVFVERLLDNGDVLTTAVDVTAHRRRLMELQATKQQLETIAYFDGLTGLANRAHCQRDLVEKFAFAAPGCRFAIVQIDLDNFKRVNDTLGHAAGDRLLQVLGRRLSLLAHDYQNFKPYRWGGDEFIALIERDGATDLEVICQELTDLVGVPLAVDGTTLRPTVSLGVARYPEDAEDLESLMIFSDLALYKTKQLGRDGFQFFTSEMKDKIDAEARLEQDLRIGLEEGQLVLHYQPQLDVGTETVTGIEALLRWKHPVRGLVGPSEFLSVAEESGLASAIGRKVFDDAMAAARYWNDGGLEFGRLSINLSPEHLRQGKVLDDFFSATRRHGVDARFLAVEFLESFLLDDPNTNVSEMLEEFREKGVHVELDDFGTGYATLSHLSTMPITGLKIDRAFVRKMVDDPKQQGIVSSLVSMARIMKLRVVCEGIETSGQVEAISGIGNCSIQGFFVARPMSFEDTTDWLRNGSNIGCLRLLPKAPDARPRRPAASAS